MPSSSISPHAELVPSRTIWASQGRRALLEAQGERDGVEALEAAAKQLGEAEKPSDRRRRETQ